VIQRATFDAADVVRRVLGFTAALPKSIRNLAGRAKIP